MTLLTGNKDGPAQTSAEGLRDRFPGELLFFGDGAAWRDLLVEVHSRPSYEEGLFVPAVPEPQIVWVLEGSQICEEREIGGEWTRSNVEAGDIFLTTSASPYEVKWKARTSVQPKVMTVYVGLPLLQEAALDLLGPQAEVPAIREFSACRDDALVALLEQLRCELMESEKASALFVQSVARSLAVHLVRCYGDRAQPRARRRPGLSAFQLANIHRFLEDRLPDSLHLGDLAQQAGISQFHFSRLFKTSTGVSPSKYLTNLRVAKARRLLRETALGILDVGFDVGYASASHFSETFRRETGLTPSEYRRSL